MKKIVAATANLHKLKEMREILDGVEIVSAQEAGFFGDVAETGECFEENALIKARAVCLATGCPALADDSGLCVVALNGEPGIFSARYSGKGEKENRALLLKNLQGKADRSAYFCCAVALVLPNGKERIELGKTFGTITEQERGENGFGYDALFLSDDLKKTFAEATDAEKNAVSHRGRALSLLKKHLTELLA